MQLVSARIWTRVTVSISYEDNHYTKKKNHGVLSRDIFPEFKWEAL